MDTKDTGLVSAEEARGCGDGGCVFRAPSDRGQHTNAGCRCLLLRMTPHERVVLRGWIRSLVVEVDYLQERLRGVGVEQYLAARDAATRERERADKAERERDRLARILAVERGDESQAPEGWICIGDEWRRDTSDGDMLVVVRVLGRAGGLVWRAYQAGDFGSALEAMEAADAAREVTRG